MAERVLKGYNGDLVIFGMQPRHAVVACQGWRGPAREGIATSIGPPAPAVRFADLRGRGRQTGAVKYRGRGGIARMTTGRPARDIRE